MLLKKIKKGIYHKEKNKKQIFADADVIEGEAQCSIYLFGIKVLSVVDYYDSEDQERKKKGIGYKK